MKGTLVNLAKFRDGVRELLNDCSADLHDRVLRGLEYGDLDSLLDSILDPKDHSHNITEEMQSTRPGYSFINDERNPFQDFRNRLVRDILDSELPNSGPALWREDRFSPAGITHWFRQISVFLEVRVFSFFKRANVLVDSESRNWSSSFTSHVGLPAARPKWQ